MTREQAKAKLISLGIAEPTEDQITNLLNSVMDEVKTEQTRAEKYKEDAEKAVELQKQLDDIQSQGLTDVEKVNKQLESANEQIALLQKQNITSEVKAILNKASISEEDYSSFLDGFIAADLETSKARANAFVATISKRDKEIDSKVREELMDNTKGLGGSGGGDDKSEAVKDAEAMATINAENAKAAKSALDFYGGKE